MASHRKKDSAGISRRMMGVIIAMLLIILLPTTVTSLPLSKIVITVSNLDAQRSVTGRVTVHGASDGDFDFVIMPGKEYTVSCSVKAGTHDVYIEYRHQDAQYYWNSIWRSYSLWPFETEDVKIEL